MAKPTLDTGAVISNGTDAPVEPVSAIASFYALVSRKTLAGQPEGGYEPEQRLTRYEALKSYTLDAAYSAFEEGIKGVSRQGSGRIWLSLIEISSLARRRRFLAQECSAL